MRPLVAALRASSAALVIASLGWGCDDEPRAGRRGSGERALTALTPALSVIDNPVEAPEGTRTGYAFQIGDPTVGASFSTQGAEGLIVTLAADAKVPVNDTASFGTGAWDFGATASMSFLSETRLFLSGSVAFWSLGDLPELTLEDVWLGTLSAGTLRPSGWSVAGFLSASSSAIAEFAAPVSLGVSASRSLDRGSLGLSVSTGITETAADVTASAFWRVPLGGVP